MKKLALALCLALVCPLVRADQTNLAEDDASQEAYNGGFESGKNGGSGFGEWKMTTEGNDDAPALRLLRRHDREQQGPHRHCEERQSLGRLRQRHRLRAGRRLSRLHRHRSQLAILFPSCSRPARSRRNPRGDPGGGSAGLTLRTSNASDSTEDYNKDAVFEFGHYDGKPNYQIFDGTGEDKTDSGVAFTDAGVSVTVTVTGEDTYDLEIQTMSDKKLTKLPGRKLKAAGAISSLAIFNRNTEKNDAFFNSLQVARENK